MTAPAEISYHTLIYVTVYIHSYHKTVPSFIYIWYSFVAGAYISSFTPHWKIPE